MRRKAKKCIYCGCTEDRACIVILDEQPQAIREQVRAHYRSHSRRPPIRTGCSWISTDPPICSAPACIRALEIDKSMAAQG